MKSLYSFPAIFHKSIGFSDSPDYVRVCAHNRDSMPDVLRYMQESNYNLLYGPFTTIEHDATCNVRNADRAHYKLIVLPGSKPSPHTTCDQEGDKTNPTP